MNRFKFSFFLLFAVMIAAPVAHADLATPPDLSYGDHFHWVFVSSVTTPAYSDSENDRSLISYFNDKVNGWAADGTLTSGVGGVWKVIGSSSSVAAINNIIPSSYPIYFLNGDRIANNHDDLWDGDDLRNDYGINVDENGFTVGSNSQVWTGTRDNGMAYDTNYLGVFAGNVRYGEVTYDAVSWISAGTTGGSVSKRLYAISAVQTVVPIPGAVWLLGSGLIGIVGIRRKLKE